MQVHWLSWYACSHHRHFWLGFVQLNSVLIFRWACCYFPFKEFISMMTTKVRSSRRRRHTRSYTLELTLYSISFHSSPISSSNRRVLAGSFMSLLVARSIFLSRFVSFFSYFRVSTWIPHLVLANSPDATHNLASVRAHEITVLSAGSSINFMFDLSMQKYFDHINFILSKLHYLSWVHTMHNCLWRHRCNRSLSTHICLWCATMNLKLWTLPPNARSCVLLSESAKNWHAQKIAL